MTDDAAVPRTTPHPARTMIRSGLVLVAVSPVMFAASLWIQSWVLYAIFGIALNVGFVLILRAWFKTPTGDGAWPFTPADGPPPTRWAPEVAFWLRWSACATGALLAISAAAWGLTWAGVFVLSTFLVSLLVMAAFVALVGWPFLLPMAVAQALWSARRTPDQEFRISIVPYKLRMRRQHFNTNWPNVEGWG